MKFNLLVLLSLFFTFNVNADESRFPRIPDLNETPGKLCSAPDAFRYPEKIAYCNRNVDTVMKAEVIRKYDSELGFNIKSMNRSDFKIDHLIPLCAGGDNDLQNLWPQHRSIYKITDPIEPVLCLKMSQGKLSQKDAVELVIYAKTHLQEVDTILAKLNSL